MATAPVGLKRGAPIEIVTREGSLAVAWKVGMMYNDFWQV
jgi:hypothetical protein